MGLFSFEWMHYNILEKKGKWGESGEWKIIHVGHVWRRSRHT